MSILAVCDTGFSSEVLNLPNICSYKDFGSKNKEHGTFIVKTILAINPNCKLALAGINIDSIESVVDSLEWIYSIHPNILNISWVTEKKNQNILDKLHKIEKDGTKIFCAKNEKFKYPWSEFTGIDQSIEKDCAPNIATKGSSISCAIFSAKQINSCEKHNVFFPNNRECQLNLEL